jgi:hypothetical protein
MLTIYGVSWFPIKFRVGAVLTEACNYVVQKIPLHVFVS